MAYRCGERPSPRPASGPKDWGCTREMGNHPPAEGKLERGAQGLPVATGGAKPQGKSARPRQGGGRERSGHRGPWELIQDSDLYSEGGGNLPEQLGSLEEPHCQQVDTWAERQEAGRLVVCTSTLPREGSRAGFGTKLPGFESWLSHLSCVSWVSY